ncbi:MAG: hypothetical protein ACOYJQ_07680 [Pseudochelatococcus sp.]|jgi:hypothetical protein|uniref:hypothetical protein n=1 Tax=Pseudochelatococcus sp. TaxID=2020869 RepID=UPI003D907950
MVRIWRVLLLLCLLPALPVAAGALVASSVHAMPAPCHDRDIHAFADVAAHEHHGSVSEADADHSPDDRFRAGDDAGCCTIFCGPCAVVAVAADAGALAPPFARRPYGWADHIARGLSVTPLLAPPRSMV